MTTSISSRLGDWRCEVVNQTLDRPAPGFNLGISVSQSPDLGRLGLTETHVRIALGEVSRAALIAGGRITYGGHLDPDGYTAFLIHECERYGARNRPFTGCVPWTVHSGLTGDEIRELRRSMGLLGRYVYLDIDGTVIEDRESVEVSDHGLDREKTSRSLTALRKHVTEHTDARVVLGGKRTGYEGRMPGVIEETILSLRARRPIFIAGGFGGAAGDVVASLGLDADGWLGLPDRSGDPGVAELVRAAAESGWVPTANGLTIEQNRQLAVSYRASEIASLVVVGLTNLRGSHE